MPHLHAHTPTVAVHSLLAQVFYPPIRTQPMPTFPGDFRSAPLRHRFGFGRRSATGYRSLRLSPLGLSTLSERVVMDDGKDPVEDSASVWVLPESAVTFSDVVR